MPVTILHTRDGKLDTTDRQQLSELEGRLSSGNPKILLHLHGGLVDEASGLAGATRLSGKGEKSFNSPDDWEQVYVIWRTGALETLKTNWKDIFENDRLYRTLLKRLISIISGKIKSPLPGGRSVGEEAGLSPAEVERRLLSGADHPFRDVDEVAGSDGPSRAAIVDEDISDIQSEISITLQRDEILNSVAADVEAALTKDEPDATRSFETGDAVLGQKTIQFVDDRVVASWLVETPAGTRSLIGGAVLKSLVKHGVAIGTRVIKRYRAHRDHGLQATIVEEIARELYGDLIGSIVWGMMKGDASDHFSAGALGDELLRILSLNANRRLLVTAHSAGSIWASDMMLAAARKNIALPVDLVFLAPAVRTGKFAEVLAKRQGDIGRFRIFAMEDALERADVLLGPGYGFLYPSSLLYFVSGLCEDSENEALPDAPLLGMQRFLDSNTPWLQDDKEGPALAAIHRFLAAGPNRTVFSRSSAGAGLNCDATSHGGFDDNALTLASAATFF